MGLLLSAAHQGRRTRRHRGVTRACGGGKDVSSLKHQAGSALIFMGGVIQIGPTAGLLSAARNNKATRLLTRPGRTSKSSAKDSSQRAVKLLSGNYLPRLPRERSYALLRSGAEAYSYPRTTCWRKSSRSGMDSDLEAFSHNPADGSFAALPGRTAAKTNYLKPRFLSY